MVVLKHDFQFVTYKDLILQTSNHLWKRTRKIVTTMHNEWKCWHRTVWKCSPVSKNSSLLAASNKNSQTKPQLILLCTVVRILLIIIYYDCCTSFIGKYYKWCSWSSMRWFERQHVARLIVVQWHLLSVLDVLESDWSIDFITYTCYLSILNNKNGVYRKM